MNVMITLKKANIKKVILVDSEKIIDKINTIIKSHEGGGEYISILEAYSIALECCQVLISSNK